MKRLLASFLSLLVASDIYAAFSVQLDAGQLRANPATGLPVGSLLILISAGADGVFETPTNLVAGFYTAGDDVLLSVISEPPSGAAFNISGGTNETINLLTITNVTPPTGQLLGLMWFPNITYAQWQAGATPTAGQTFGFYNPKFWNGSNSSNNPDGGDPWIVPNAGSLISLDFFTTDSGGGGTQAPMEGYGNEFAVFAVPEPGTWSLLGLGGLGSLGLTCLRGRRRFRAATTAPQND
jgi:hypothetical protein